MRKLQFTILALAILMGCTDDVGDESSSFTAIDDGGSGNGNQSGVITAGEWNDLKEWTFWKDIISTTDYKEIPKYWSFFPKNRISVNIADSNGDPMIDALVQLKQGTSIVYTSKADNKGNAELWIDLFQNNSCIDLSKYSIDINNGEKIIDDVLLYEQGINRITLPTTNLPQNRIEISFVVDATGSMGDELEYLKTELYDVIVRSKSGNPNSIISLSSVFYRDNGDEYVTLLSNFSDNIQTTIDFIKAQSASGGGDFPEAVHEALDKSVNELQWSSSAKTKLIFLLLDAPPHHDNTIINSLQNSVALASAKGIKIIPITASGIDKETEFLMRFIALSTNSTYVFITDDSGIGNEHLKPSVGNYQIEFLNNLMVRLINEYSE